jgi:hypothetical protein
MTWPGLESISSKLCSTLLASAKLLLRLNVEDRMSLHHFEQTQAQHVRHRDWLRDELEGHLTKG